MKKLLILCLAVNLCLLSCVSQSQHVDDGFQALSSEASGADVFNPWRNDKLPTSRHLSKDGTSILGSIGGGAQSIQGEARHRPNWRAEIYPIVFGSKGAPHEVLVILDFANPESETLWNNVLKAMRSMSPQNVKVVVFGKSSELYGADLTGFLVWMLHERNAQATQFLSYALSRWNEVKAEQKRQGRVKVFANEYDATAKPSDLPILYSYLSRLKPPVSERDELAISRYSYDAGNVNMYQAMQVCSYYRVEPPCVLVDGRSLGLANAATIVQHVGQ